MINSIIIPPAAACMEMLGDNQDAKPLYEESLRLRMVREMCE